MEHITYKPKEARKESDTLNFLKYFLFTYNLVIFLCGLVLLAIGIWLGVDRNFMTTIIGNNLYAAAVFLILAGGGMIFIISFFGCCGVIRESICLLFAFFVVLCIISACLIIGGICALAFRGQIGNKIKDTMSSTLTDYYGVNFQSEYNRAVTDAWDKAQERLKCCAVSSNGWYLYRQSKWFQQFGAYTGRTLTFEEDPTRPYVPLSCCVKDVFWRYINQQVCQIWRLGPPGAPVDGAINRAVYYDGCYDAGVQYLNANSVVLVGLGLAIGIFLILGIVISAMILLSLRRQKGTS
jgi:hypothetical protein